MVYNMSLLNYLTQKTKAGLETFFKIVTLSNRSYPYHDYETATLTATKKTYQVGSNNVGQNGSQNKLFIAKSTLILSTVDAYIVLNNSNNVPMLLLANNYYIFKSDIRVIYYYYSSEQGTIYIHCEGTHPQEGRVAE